MVYSLLELDTWEFRRVNRYLEQVMEDIQEESIGEELQPEQCDREKEEK